jgi:DNA-binding transcriptional MerR regulator
MSSALPDKQFFKIGEAAEIVGVKAHVLRYWESEFSTIKPLKTRGAHRMYRRADVELLCVIHKLLHQEGYTIAGARKRVRELRGLEARGTVREQGEEQPESEVAEAARELALRAELIQVRNDLAGLLAALDAPRVDKIAPRDASATVTAVVPKTVLIPQRKLPL